MKKFILSVIFALGFISVSSLFVSRQAYADHCRITNQAQVEYGKPYSITISPTNAGRVTQAPIFPLTIEGVNVVLPNGELNSNGASSYTLSTELGVGKYNLSVVIQEGDLRNGITQHTACTGSIEVLASTDPNVAVPTPLPTASASDNYSIILSLDVANEKKDQMIEAIISGLKTGKKYMVCHIPNEESCNNAIRSPGGASSDMFTNIENTGNTVVLKICGDGDERVKVNDCDNEDYFHGGNIYGLLLYEIDHTTPLAGDNFYVTRYYPGIRINATHIITESNTDRTDINDPDNVVVDNSIMLPVANFPKGTFDIGGSLKVQVHGGRPNLGKSERNDYQFVLEAQNYQYKEEECRTVSGTDQLSDLAIFGADSDDKVKTLGQGSYILKINDRINAGTLLRRNDCQGGFTFYHILFDLEKSADGSGLTMRVREVIIDPNRTDVFALADASKSKSISPLPCAKYDEITETCLEINVPIFGIIGTKPVEFLMTLGQRILALASVAAFVVMVYAGYQILISRGDKEKVANARELITSAVTGLIFIVLSVAILEIIGVDILQIPGFTR